MFANYNKKLLSYSCLFRNGSMIYMKHILLLQIVFLRVFSIPFQTPYALYSNSTRGSARINEFLNILEVQDRLIWN